MNGAELHLAHDWVVGTHIAGGGFGQVYEATSTIQERAVAKFVPKAPGAQRELLFVELGGVPNVVPILDSGEYQDFWVLIMPRADVSLAERLEAEGPMELDEALSVLGDVADALVGLSTKEVVHRDLKPANVLLLAGRWCLSDFGISRYADATSAADTRKFAMSPPYAAPERWRFERATAASDVYSFGCMAYELVSGARPFDGEWDELRDKHLHHAPDRLADVPAALAALIDECLYKSPESRPSADGIRARLDNQSLAATGGLAALQDANRVVVQQRAEATRQQSIARTEAERLEQLQDSGIRNFETISAALTSAFELAAPTADVERHSQAWRLRLNRAVLTLTAPNRTQPTPDDPINVALSSKIELEDAQNRDYIGRSHSLWFCDAVVEGEFAWFETAFMDNAMIASRSVVNPYSMPPGEPAWGAIGNGIGNYQVAWPFSALVAGALDEFIGRWAGWLAQAAAGSLRHPTHMPEGNPNGTWRRR